MALSIAYFIILVEQFDQDFQNVPFPRGEFRFELCFSHLLYEKTGKMNLFFVGKRVDPGKTAKFKEFERSASSCGKVGELIS